MKKHLLLALTALCAMFALSSTASAQFETGKVYLGPHVGLGSVGGTVAFGGDIEYGLTKSGEVGSGRIGIGGTFDYWSWSDGAYWSYSWIPVGVFGAYHFNLDNRRLDPFLGIGLGYEIVNATVKDGDNTVYSSASYASATYISAVAGMRYFFSPNFAIQGRLGLGASWLTVGVDFGL